MKKLAFFDIGELGWSLYLAAYLRGLRKDFWGIIRVYALKGRGCLYKDLANEIFPIPPEFYTKYEKIPQNCGGLWKVPEEELREFFRKKIPSEYEMPWDAPLYCRKFKGPLIHKPFSPTQVVNIRKKKEIIIFPRARPHRMFRVRNLPKEFYIKLITKLCKEFPALKIRTVGIKKGAYKIRLPRPKNYIDWVRDNDSSLQEVIDLFEESVATIGGQSAMPKLALFQGVPSFIIGNEKGRHMNKDNWSNTKVGFYEITQTRIYRDFNHNDCISKAIEFVRDCQ